MERASGRAGQFLPRLGQPSDQQGIHPRLRPRLRDGRRPDSLHIPIYAHTNMEAHNTHLLLVEVGFSWGSGAQLYPGVLGMQSPLHRVRMKTSRRQF